MAQVTASLVKELRDRTGLGMMECKRALNECWMEISKKRLKSCVSRAA